MRDCHGVGTVHRAIHAVCNSLFELRENFISWPENPHNLTNHFYKMAGMP